MDSRELEMRRHYCRKRVQFLLHREVLGVRLLCQSGALPSVVAHRLPAWSGRGPVSTADAPAVSDPASPLGLGSRSLCGLGINGGP